MIVVDDNSSILARMINDEINHNLEQCDKINIIVTGKGNAGKTHLIDTIFGEQSDEGETISITERRNRNCKYAITEIPGFDVDENLTAQRKEIIKNIIKKSSKEKELKNKIHCIWYCVQCENKRISSGETRFIQSITNESSLYNVPVIIIITQAFDRSVARTMVEDIKKKNLKIIGVIPILASARTIDDGTENQRLIKAYGLQNLIDTMTNHLPEYLKKTLIQIQNVSTKLKKNYALSIIITASTASLLIDTFVFDDFKSWILLGGTISMSIAGISYVYNAGFGFSFFLSFIAFAFEKRDKIIQICEDVRTNPILEKFQKYKGSLLTFGILTLYWGFVHYIYNSNIDFNQLSEEQIRNHFENILQSPLAERLLND